MRGLPARLRRHFHDLRTEGAGASRETAAVALGVFIGCLPLYGLHLLICWGLGLLLGLNRLKMYLAANISNPLVAPWLLFAEVQAGAWLRRGSFHALTREAVVDDRPRDLRHRRGWSAAWSSARCWRWPRLPRPTASSGPLAADRPFAELVRRAVRSVSRRQHHGVGVRPRQAADAIRSTARRCRPGCCRSGGTLVDIGCGQGLTLALLAEARRAYDAGTWPADSPPPPRFDAHDRHRDARAASRRSRETALERRSRGHRRRCADGPARAGVRRAAVRRPPVAAAGRAGSAARRGWPRVSSRAASCSSAKPTRRPVGALRRCASATG